MLTKALLAEEFGIPEKDVRLFCSLWQVRLPGYDHWWSLRGARQLRRSKNSQNATHNRRTQMAKKFVVREPKPEPKDETVEFFLRTRGDWVELWASTPKTGEVKVLLVRPGESLCREALPQDVFAILGLMPENNHSCCRMAIHP